MRTETRRTFSIVRPEELYIRALTRKPKPDELKALLELQTGEKPDAQFYKDLFSSLLNSSEFLFQH